MAAVVVHMLPESISRTCFGGFTFVKHGYQGVRSLFAPAAIGIDNYARTRDRTKTQFINMSDKFKAKMDEFSNPNSTNMIFTEDLKNMIHLAEETPEDLNLVCKMIKRFNQQNKEVRFGSFVFGTVVMRMYYYLNKPNEALEIFKDPQLEDFFSQLSTYQILMDLMFENERYQDVLNIFDIVKSRQHQEAKFPRNVVILALGACYKLNTEESFKYAMNLWNDLKTVGHKPMRRAVTFAAGLALNQNAPHIALEIISSMQQQNYVTIRNLKIAALADVGRPEDALPILRSCIDIDIPTPRKQTVSEEALEKLKDSIQKTENKEIIYEFHQLEKRLREGGHTTKMDLDEQLCGQIAETVKTFNQERNQRVLAASFSRQDQGHSRPNFRPGLNELN